MNATKAGEAHEPVSFDPRHRPLFATKHWGVLLHRNQWNLGRCIVYLRNRRAADPLELTAEERDELWSEVFPRLARGLNAAFQPDRLNYSHLANRTHQVHWHVTPRYDTRPIRVFAGYTFKDKRQGRTPRSKKKGNVPPEVLAMIADALRPHLS